MKPMAAASRTIRAVLLLIHELISMNCNNIPIATRTPKVHEKIVGRCFLTMCFQRCSSMKWSDALKRIMRTITLKQAKRTFIQFSLRRSMW